MRILVISDTHGDFFALNDAVKRHSIAEIVFFLGDGYKELCDVEALYPEKKFLAVKGTFSVRFRQLILFQRNLAK